MWRDTVTKTRERFNPRAPCGARQIACLSHVTVVIFQSTRPLRGATGAGGVSDSTGAISTHAPIAGRDVAAQTIRPLGYRISTHAPIAGRDDARMVGLDLRVEFQPTRPLRGATLVAAVALLEVRISTHAPLAGRDGALVAGRVHGLQISTHAPLAGRDKGNATRFEVCNISTHAPLAGRDSKSVQITMHIFAITDKFQMFLRKMPTVRAFCFFFVREKRANFSANRPDNFCALVLRTIRSSVPRADTSACSRSVRFYSHTSCPSSKIEGCPFLGQ